MNIQLNNLKIEEFWHTLYFGRSNNFTEAAVKRAYRDFNRTIRKIPTEGDARLVWKNKLVNVILNQISELLKTNFPSWEEYNFWHRQSIDLLIVESDEILTLGQSQKWLNMTIKYLICFGEDRINGIMKNYHHYHVPIDNIIQKRLYGKYKIIPIALGYWSKIKEYDEYLKYQNNIRQNINGQIPMDVEFVLFSAN